MPDEMEKRIGSSEKYLRDTEGQYTFDLQNGLYLPATDKPQLLPTRSRPKGSWADWSGVVVAAVGLLVSVATLLGLFLTVAFSIKQWEQAKRTADASVDAATASEASADAAKRSLLQHDADRRPYVVCKVLGNLSITSGQIIRSNVELINWGQSIAKNVTLDGHIWFGKDIPLPVDKYFAALPKRPKSADSSFLIPKIGEDDPKSPSFQYSTIDTSNAAVSDKALEFIKSHDDGVVVAGRIWYTDTVGTQHWTDFCYFTLVSGAMASCEKHNEIH